jgi:hypothetical protein
MLLFTKVKDGWQLGGENDSKNEIFRLDRREILSSLSIVNDLCC